MSLPIPKVPFNLLLVEDEFADALMFQEMLEEVSSDLTVHHVVNGQEALSFLRRSPGYEQAPRPNLIVLDLNMPVMNGHDFLKQAKLVASLRSIPVLVLSTSSEADDIQRSYDGQASGYIVKPGNYDEYKRIMATIESYWRGVIQLPFIAEIKS